MKKRTTAIVLFGCLALAGTLHAQNDHLIENQRTNIVHNAAWGDTYLGKYTPGNALGVVSNATLSSADVFVGYSDTASSNFALVADDSTWTMDSLQIGTTNNSDNLLVIIDGGIVEIDGGLTVQGTNNGNALWLADGGTLYMKSDFDAQTDGFVFGTNSTLKVGGRLSNMDQVEGRRHLVLTGAGAEWLLNTNTVNIGAVSDGNSLELEGATDLAFENVSVGAAGTVSNTFIVGSGSHSTVSNNLWVTGSGNRVEVAGGNLDVLGDLTSDDTIMINGGSLDVLGNLTSSSTVQFSGSGALLAYNNVDLSGIDGGGTMYLTGSNARWTNNANVQVGVLAGNSTLAIEGQALMRVDNITIGSPTGSGNIVMLSNGGKLVINGIGSSLYDDSTLWIDDGGWLTFGSDFSSALSWTNATITWQHGGTVEFQGEAPVIQKWWVEGAYDEYGTLFLGKGRTMILNGSNAYLPAETNNFHLGDLSSDNTLAISNGAWAAFKTVSIGDFQEGGHSNLLVVSGTGSAVTNLGFTAIGGTMIGGTWHEGGNNNILRVEDGALFYSPDTLHNRNTTGSSGLEIASGALVDVDGYYQSSGAYLTVLTDSSGTNMGLLRANMAEFEADARVGVDAVSRLQIDQTYTNTIVEAGTLVIAGVTNATTADLANLETSGGSLVNFDLSVESGTNIVATYRRRYLSEASGFDPDTMLAEIADEIDTLAMLGNAAASNQLDILSTMNSSQMNNQLKQLYAYQLPTYMHGQAVFGGIDQVRARGLSFHGASTPDTMLQPEGVMGPGPHAADQGLQGWIKAYGSFGSQDKADFNDGYDAQTFGTIIGFDQAFDEWLFGLAGGFAGSTLDADNGDESDASTGYGMLYASYGTKEWFGDLVLTYGLSDIENDSGGAFDVKSSTDASQTAFYVGGGKEYKDPDGSDALLRPLLALQISQYDQDSYTEKSSNAVAKDVDGFDRWSYQSIFGAEMILPTAGTKVDLETQLRLYWIHEFNDDEEKVDYTLVGSSQPGRFVMHAPESDVAQFGIGCVARWESGVQLRADVDSRISGGYIATTISGALLYEF